MVISTVVIVVVMSSVVVKIGVDITIPTRGWFVVFPRGATVSRGIG